MTWLIVLGAAGFGAWAVARFYLSGADLRAFDTPVEPSVGARDAPSAEHQRAVARLAEYGLAQSGRNDLAAFRRQFDEIGAAQDLDDVTIAHVDADGVPAEWVMTPGADTDRRLLFIHGGAFLIGSPRSHRLITVALSRTTRSAVLAIDYRLMPEHRRLDSLEDSQRAYRFMLHNGPEGVRPAAHVMVAGDSAGGNLTLTLLNWARDDPGVTSPDCAVAFSPSTDSTLRSPSMRENITTDPMLGPGLGRLVKLPLTVRLWVMWLASRIRPCDPRVSPIFADLAGLPPTLVLASEAEMLLDDARRYVNKARAAGSPVELATWRFMLHVWPMFVMPEADEAFEHIGGFVGNAVEPQRSVS